MTTFPLSTGTDSVAGTANADLIAGKSTEWQAADTINGGSGTDQLQITAISAATAIVTDALFQKVSSLETLTLLDSFAETVTVGALSDAAGLAEINGSGLTGALTVDATGRIGGIVIDSSKGVNTLLGSVNDDTFRFTSAGFAGTDTVNGGGTGDADTIQITDKAAVVDAAFAKVTHVEHLALGGGAIDYTGQKVALGKLSIDAGITDVDVLDAQGATLDATARSVGVAFHGNNGNDVFKASQGNDAFLGGAGSDSYQVKGAQFTFTDAMDGGSGRDEIRILDSGTPIIDVDFAHIGNVETFAFNANATQTVAIGGFAMVSGLDTIDASKLTGSLNLTVSSAFAKSLEVKLGSGADTLNLGNAGSHTVTMKSTNLTKLDTLIGSTAGHDVLAFTDAVKLTDKYFLNAAGVDNFGALLLENAGKGQSLVAGATFTTFAMAAGLQYVMADSSAKDTSFNFDFSQYAGNTIFVLGSGGSDVFTAGAVDLFLAGVGAANDLGAADTFRFKSTWYNATDFVVGGKSTTDVLSILDTTTDIVDADFTMTSKIEHLRLEQGAAGTSYTLTLGTKFDGSGMDIVDATKAGVNVGINAGATKQGHTFIASAKDNVLIGGSEADVFQFDTKTLNGSDFVTGGTSNGHGDTLQFTTGGVIGATALTNVSGIEFIQLSDKGNSIALTNALVGTGEMIAVSYDGIAFPGRTFVLTGSGKDTVDLSQLTTSAGAAAVIGSAGGDKYIGTDAVEAFVFQKSSDLTSATQIDGGPGSDVLLLAGGTYAAAQFKGVKHVENIYLSDADPTASFKLTLDNTAFANAGHHLTVLPMIAATGAFTIDASSVTDPLAQLVVLAPVADVVLKGTAGDDVFTFGADNSGTFELNGKDLVVGGDGMDTIALTNNFAGPVALTDGYISGISGIETLLVNVGAGTDFLCNPDSVFQSEGIAEIDGLASHGKLEIDAGLYTTAITLHAGQSDDDLETGTGNDTIAFDHIGSAIATLDGNDKVDGGAGINRLLFNGDANLVDVDFAQVSQIQSLVLENGTFTVTLGANSDLAEIDTVDGSAADAAVIVFGAVSNKGLTLIGSHQVDLLQGGSGIDRIAGGDGGDFLYGKGGNDIFVYGSAADSRQLAGNDLSHADVLEDFAAGDLIDVSALTSGAISIFNHGTVVNFISTDTANYFGANDLATATNGSLTRVYIDANHDGNFNLSQDVVIQVVGNHIADTSNTATYI